jgi:hypothetical protein
MDRLIYRTLILGIILIFTECSPIVHTSTNDKKLIPLSPNEEVLVISLNQSVPDNCNYVGRVRIGDTGFTTDCSYSAVIEKAKEKARKTGGNIIKLTEINPPNFASSCYQIKADIYFTNDIKAVGNKLLIVQDPELLNNFGSNPNFAVIYLFRPKNYTGSAISYDVHIGDSIVRRVKNNSKFAIKLYREGKTEVWAKTESLASLTIDVKFGEEYYLKCGIKTGFWVGVPEMNFLDKSQGRSEYLNVENKHK